MLTCAKCKPNYYQPSDVPLIRAMAPFDRLSIEFKGPIPKSKSSNTYILTVIDEYSRFPFAFPTRDIRTATVIKCLTGLFSLFGMPSYIHSDRGASFMSAELKSFLSGLGVASSRTTPYHPQGNSQCERYNGTIWKTVSLALEDRSLPVHAWEDVLPDALHSIRSLLCTSTNETPHERMFKYNRRSATGCAVPTWLSSPGPVLLRRHVRHSKNEPLTEDVQLIEANPTYAHVRFQDGRESTVSVRDLAPSGGTSVDVVRTTSDEANLDDVVQPSMHPDLGLTGQAAPSGDGAHSSTQTDQAVSSGDVPSTSHRLEPNKSPLSLRRSSRTVKPVERLNL